MEDLDAQLCSPEKTSPAELISFFSTDSMYSGISLIIWGLRQARKDICSYVAGKLTAEAAQEHALNSLRNEPNLLLQPILQNCLSILTSNSKKQQCMLKKKKKI